VPFAVILGEDEIRAGKIKIKELGLEEGHPEKNGVDVDVSNLVSELKTRIAAWETRTNEKKLLKSNGTVVAEKVNGVEEVGKGVEEVKL